MIDPLERLRLVVGETARWLAEAYGLEIDLAAESFVMDAEAAREHLDGPVPRSGLLALEQGEELRLGIYLDPRDADDPAVVLEETSHWLCLAWHAARDLPVSGLVLELQSDVDRFLFVRQRGHDPLAHLGEFRWADWVEETHRPRYALAHAAAARYCRSLARRFPDPRDTPGLIRELRSFYRASPQAKLRVAA